jgi:hypothetical protein
MEGLARPSVVRQAAASPYIAPHYRRASYRPTPSDEHIAAPFSMLSQAPIRLENGHSVTFMTL